MKMSKTTKPVTANESQLLSYVEDVLYGAEALLEGDGPDDRKPGHQEVKLALYMLCAITRGI